MVFLCIFHCFFENCFLNRLPEKKIKTVFHHYVTTGSARLRLEITQRIGSIYQSRQTATKRRRVEVTETRRDKCEAISNAYVANVKTWKASLYEIRERVLCRCVYVGVTIGPPWFFFCLSFLSSIFLLVFLCLSVVFFGFPWLFQWFSLAFLCFSPFLIGFP